MVTPNLAQAGWSIPLGLPGPRRSWGGPVERGQEGSTEDSAMATSEGEPMGAQGERLGGAGASSPHRAGGRSLQSPGGLVAPVSSLRSREKWGPPSPRWAPGEGSTGKQGSSLEALASHRMLAHPLTPPAAGLHQGSLEQSLATPRL